MNAEHPHSDFIAVLGGGESGIGAALLAKSKGYDVLVSDFGKMKDRFRAELEENGIAFEEGGHDHARILSASIVVKSPGIPEKAPIVKAIRQQGIPVVSEIEWAYRFLDGKVIAITGSNGKTTTTSLIWHIMHKAGLDVALAGNIGKSLARTVSERAYAWYVVEVSSFQLDDIDTFRPHISVITNITEDHLDRYQYDVRNYIASKMKITANQQDGDYCLYCIDDPVSDTEIQKIHHTQCIPFSWDQTLTEGAFRENDHITFILKKNDSLCP